MNTNKTNVGHGEGGAAMTSLVSAVLQVKKSKGNACIHLQQLNPHLESSQFNMILNSELCGFRFDQGHVHVSSFGFGGTNGHAIFWGTNLYNEPDMGARMLKRIK